MRERAMKNPGIGDSTYNVNVITFSVVRDVAQTEAGDTLSAPSAVYALARAIIPDDAREHFVALYLNAQNVLIAAHEVGVGSLSATIVHPREVFGPALRIMGVASIILVHNHPSGDPTPSREDVRLTRQLVEAGHLLDVPVHDHLVITHTGKYTSMAESGIV